MSEPKFIIKADSDQEPAFILSTRRPKFKGLIHKFENEQYLAGFSSENPYERVRNKLMIIEAVEIEENFNPNQLAGSLKRMCDWLYFKN